jgi:hypothetical protein
MRAVRGQDQKGRSLSGQAWLGEPGKKVGILPADLPDADMWLNFSGDSWTVIPNLDYNATIVAKSSNA